jgi:predicted PurR-regulated permease PerM
LGVARLWLFRGFVVPFRFAVYSAALLEAVAHWLGARAVKMALCRLIPFRSLP